MPGGEQLFSLQREILRLTPVKQSQIILYYRFFSIETVTNAFFIPSQISYIYTSIFPNIFNNVIFYKR